MILILKLNPHPAISPVNVLYLIPPIYRVTLLPAKLAAEKVLGFTFLLWDEMSGGRNGPFVLITNSRQRPVALEETKGSTAEPQGEKPRSLVFRKV